MFKKLQKSGLSLLLALTLILAPQSAAFAAGAPAAGSLLIDTTGTPVFHNLAPYSTDVLTTDALIPYSAETPAAQDLRAYSVDSSDSLADAAQKRADLLTKVYGVTSVQYALISDGKIILSGVSGYTDKASKKAPTDTTMYGIGSVSKIFTTLAVLKLAEEGKVNLDTPVVTYLPEFKMADSRYTKITVRMLLNHSSGLMGSTLGNAILLGETDTTTHDNFLALLKTQRLKADPGAFSVYCNDGFTLAEILIEKISGKSFSQFIADTFTDSLDMKNTKTPSDSFQTSKLAGIYAANGTKLPYETLCAYGAGGLFSTAEDLCRLAAVVTNQTSLLSSTSVNSMKSEEYKRGQWFSEEDSVLSYGLGWDSVHTYPFTDYNITALMKGGDSLYYHCGFTVLPDENMAVAVLSSGGASTYNEIFGQSILLDALKEKGRIASIHEDKTFSAPVKTVVPDSLLSYSGYYGNYSVPYKISIDKSGTLLLASSAAPTAAQQYVYSGNNRFYSLDGSNYLSFSESSGNTYLYYSGYSKIPALGQTAMSLYLGQRLNENKITDSVKKAWAKYLNKNYYIVSEKYSSALYMQALLKSRLETTEGLPNYIASNPITDETSANSTLQIPGVYGRDLGDLKLIEKNGVKYIQSGSSLLICEDSIGTLSPKKAFTVTIPKSGYAQYFKISNKSSNKKITVTLPKKSSFTVYDSKENVVFSSYVSGKKTVTLPKKGTIVFSGAKNAKFGVKYTAK